MKDFSINSCLTQVFLSDLFLLYFLEWCINIYLDSGSSGCLPLQVRGVMEKYPPYQSIFAKLSYGESQLLDKAFYEEEVKRLCLAFEQQVCTGGWVGHIYWFHILRWPPLLAPSILSVQSRFIYCKEEHGLFFMAFSFFVVFNLSVFTFWKQYFVHE